MIFNKANAAIFVSGRYILLIFGFVLLAGLSKIDSAFNIIDIILLMICIINIIEFYLISIIMWKKMKKNRKDRITSWKTKNINIKRYALFIVLQMYAILIIFSVLLIVYGFSVSYESIICLVYIVLIIIIQIWWIIKYKKDYFSMFKK